MSDKVQMIASVIYKEFEALIQKFGPDSVKVHQKYYQNLTLTILTKIFLGFDAIGRQCSGKSRFVIS